MEKIEALIAERGGTIEIDWSDRFNQGVLIWSKNRAFEKVYINAIQFAQLQQIIDPSDVPFPSRVLVFNEPTKIKLL
jgi:hypothetical protein